MHARAVSICLNMQSCCNADGFNDEIGGEVEIALSQS
jgi:hypothetical protein